MSSPDPITDPESQLILDQVAEMTTIAGVDTSTATDDQLIAIVRNIVDPTTLTMAATGDANAIMFMRAQMGLPTS